MVVIKVGPWGAPGGHGHPCDIISESMPQSLASITICSSESSSNGRIIGISFVYVEDHNKEPITVGPWGKIDKQYNSTTIEMGLGEYIVELSGTADGAGITSLTLKTNKSKNQRYGWEAGSPFSVPLHHGDSRVVAFFGRSDDTLKALGTYVRPVNGWQSPVKIGPWGSFHGTPTPPYRWEPSYHLQSITVYSTDSSDDDDGRIYGFSFTYVDDRDQNGQPKPIIVGPWGTTKGQEYTLSMSRGECLNNFSGTFDDHGMTSLKFTTNQAGLYGPYGCERGTAFSVPLPDDPDRNHKGAVVGFFGTHHPGDKCLPLIGIIYVVHAALPVGAIIAGVLVARYNQQRDARKP